MNELVLKTSSKNSAEIFGYKRDTSLICEGIKSNYRWKAKSILGFFSIFSVIFVDYLLYRFVSSILNNFYIRFF